jgi:hypothetical protein
MRDFLEGVVFPMLLSILMILSIYVPVYFIFTSKGCIDERMEKRIEMLEECQDRLREKGLDIKRCKIDADYLR